MEVQTEPRNAGIVFRFGGHHVRDTGRGIGIAIWTMALPIGLFAGYIACQVVPDILRIVVPAVVRAVATS